MRNTSLKLEPLLNNNDKVQKYQWAIQFVNENRYFFDLPRILKNLFLKKDYTNLMFEYEKATSIHESLSARGANESILRESSIVERIWNEVELVMDRYRKYCWDKLAFNATCYWKQRFSRSILAITIEINRLESNRESSDNVDQYENGVLPEEASLKK